MKKTTKIVLIIVVCVLFFGLGRVFFQSKKIKPFIKVLEYVDIYTGIDENFKYTIDTKTIDHTMLLSLPHLVTSPLIESGGWMGIVTPVDASVQISGSATRFQTKAGVFYSLEEVLSISKNKKIIISGDIGLELSDYQPSDCSNILPGKADFGIEFIKRDVREGKQSIQLISHNHNACIAPAISTILNEKFLYKVSIDYKHITGNQGSLYISLQWSGKSFISEFSLSGRKEERTNHSFIIDPGLSGRANGAFFIYAFAESGGYTINEYDNFTIEPYLPVGVKKLVYMYKNNISTGINEVSIIDYSSKSLTLKITGDQDQTIIYTNIPYSTIKSLSGTNFATFPINKKYTGIVVNNSKTITLHYK